MKLQLSTLVSGATFALVLTLGMSVFMPSGQAGNDNNGAQDEKQMIATGLAVAANDGITLNMTNKDPDMVGLGSYLVNVSGDCNGCHSSGPTMEFKAGHNPYLLPGPNPPFFSGRKQVNPMTYLGGGRSFGSFGPGPKGEIISRNLTPDKTGLAEGGSTLTDFIQIMRTGVDLDHVHPSCSTTITTNCLSFPFNGALLQVMRTLPSGALHQGIVEVPERGGVSGV